MITLRAKYGAAMKTPVRMLRMMREAALPAGCSLPDVSVPDIFLPAEYPSS